MKKQMMSALLCASMILGGSVAVLAEETELTEIAALEISLGDETLEISDETVKGITAVEAEDDADTEEEGDLVVTLTDADDNAHVFKAVDLDDAADVTVQEKLNFVYLVKTAQDETVTYFAEEGEEEDLDESVTMYTLTRVNMREAADAEAEVVVVTEVNTELEVIGAAPAWYHVKTADNEGYIVQQYLTDDADEAAEAQQKAEETAAAEAAAAAAAAAAGSGSAGGGGDACLTGGVLN